MTWEAALQQSGNRPCGLALVESRDQAGFHRAVSELSRYWLENRQQPEHTVHEVLERAALSVAQPWVDGNGRRWLRGFLSLDLLPSRSSGWDSEVEWELRERRVRTLRDSLSPLGNLLVSTKPLNGERLGAFPVIPIDPCSHWMYELFERGLSRDATGPLLASRETWSQASGDVWAAVIPDAVAASQALVDQLLPHVPQAAVLLADFQESWTLHASDDISSAVSDNPPQPAAASDDTAEERDGDASATREARDADPTLQGTSKTWPPDDGWHFDLGRAAFLGTVVEMSPKLLLFLKILAEAPDKSPAVEWVRFRDEWNLENGEYDLSRESITADIAVIRGILKKQFACPAENPIENVARGKHCSWKLVSSVLKPAKRKRKT